MACMWQSLYTESDLREAERRKNRELLPAVTFGVVALFLYLIIMRYVRADVEEFLLSRFGKNAANLSFLVLGPPALVVFLVPCILAERKIKGWWLRCPSCSLPLEKIAETIATRCCPKCDEQIVVARRRRSRAAYRRMWDRHVRQFLVYWLWSWAVLSAAGTVWWYFDPAAAAKCSIVWLATLIGATASAWTWLRTLDRRYFLQVILSMVFLVVESVIVYSWI